MGVYLNNMEDRGVWGGVYKIINNITNDCYIGSSINLYNRRKTHFSKLRLNYSTNKYLQKDFNKYGENNFSFEILENITTSDLLTKEYLYKREQYFINILKPKYNISKIAGSNKGYKFSKESLKNRSEKQSIKILQYDLNNNFIKEWESSLLVNKILKINNSHIRECCNNKRKSAGGFIWKNK